MLRLRMGVEPSKVVLLAAFFLAAGGAGSWAADEPYQLLIKDHRFEPQELRVPAGKKVKIIVQNQDPTPEEFESYPLKREKVIGGRSSAVIYVGPLAPGTYPFFGEFHPQTAQGQLIAEAAVS